MTQQAVILIDHRSSTQAYFFLGGRQCRGSFIVTAHVIGTPEHRGVGEAVRRGHVENFRRIVLGLVEVIRGSVGFTASFEFLGIVGITVIDVVIGDFYVFNGNSDCVI